MGRTRIGLGVLAIAAFASVCSFAVAASPKKVPLAVSVNGSGSVRLSTGQHLTCKKVCTKTFAVRRGTTITLRAQPTVDWKLMGWTGGCRASNPACRLRISKPSHASVTFVPPGARINPIPLGQAADVADGWSLKVVSVTPDADAQVVATPYPNVGPQNTPPPPGAQDFMALLSATYIGGGSGEAYALMNLLSAMGAHNAEYDLLNNSCGAYLPQPDLGNLPDPSVFSGQTITGNVCWQIASNDAASLEMAAGFSGDPASAVWFALH